MKHNNNTIPAPAYFDVMTRTEIGRRLFLAMKEIQTLQPLNIRPLYPVLQIYLGNHKTSMTESIMFAELADFFFAANNT